MTGSSVELAALSSKLFVEDTKLRELVHNTVLFLLDNQFIVNPRGDSNTYKVVKGSGMGLAHSGAVAEAALLAGFEIDLVPRMHQYGIDLYLRFEDDIFIVFSDLPLLHAFFAKMKIGHPFIIECESINSFECQFLDVLIQKQASCYQLAPQSKASNCNAIRGTRLTRRPRW